MSTGQIPEELAGNQEDLSLIDRLGPAEQQAGDISEAVAAERLGDPDRHQPRIAGHPRSPRSHETNRP